ncbi:MAG: trypsin-like peptidase domain-containing protein [Phycisphaerae bacterium]|nr:trypsin-like peptidase domain-containing protein [Phycisphaerae bacterium]
MKDKRMKGDGMKSSTGKASPRRLLILILAQALCAAHSAPAWGDEGTSLNTDRLAERMTPVVKVFQEASPAVVNISTTRIVTRRESLGFGGLFDDVFDFPMSRPRQYEAHSVGSGFLIHGDGYLVTNAHVVDRVAECRITFADGTELLAEQVAIDRKNDLAVLKVDAKKPLPHVRLGRSDDLMPGETVIAIGNPLGYQHTITTGIVSAVDRELQFGRDITYSGLIQTDASINPGNSGGPLLNILGELIGINTAIRGDAQNIGFAIPVNHLHKLLPVMLDIERLRRVQLGVHFDGDVTHAKKDGVRIELVDAGSPAAEAGVRPGDVVTAIDGRPAPTFMEAFRILERAPVGKKLKLDVLRDGGKHKTIEVLLAEVAKPDAEKLMWSQFGIRIRELTPSDQRQLGLRQPIGLLVSEVSQRSQAEREGVEPGDLVTTFGGWPVTTLDTLGHLLNQVNAGDRIAVRVWRIGRDAIIQTDLVLEAR